MFDIFAVTYWALQVRMVGVREQARLNAERQKLGSAGTSDRIGERTKQIRLWRGIGRSLFDVRMMVFNMGRSDFRAKHTATNALIVQTIVHSSIETTRYCMDMYLAPKSGSVAGCAGHHSNVGSAAGARRMAFGGQETRVRYVWERISSDVEERIKRSRERIGGREAHRTQ